MKAILKIEAIGDNTDQTLRAYRNLTNSLVPRLGDATFGKPPASYWVAEILGPDPRYKWKRKFLRGKKDYSKANSKGSRGVFAWYTLESGRVYEVKEKISWKNSRRYFCRVTEEGDIVEIPESEVLSWLAIQITDRKEKKNAK